MAKLRKLRRLLKETLAEWQARDVSLLASALAYSTVFSLAPLMIIVIMIVGAIFGEATAKEQIVNQLTELVGAEGAELIATAIANTREQTGENPIQLIISVGILAFGASNIFAQIQDALDRIWEVRPAPGRHIINFLRKRLLSFTMILAIAFLLLVSFVANTVLLAIVTDLSNWLPGLEILWQIFRWIASFVVATTVFALMYTILPDAEIDWHDTLVGAMITAALFVLGQSLFGVFLSLTNVGSAYGVAGSFLIIITWVFYAAQILFLGAAFTKVYARQTGTPIVPSEFAVPASEENPNQKPGR